MFVYKRQDDKKIARIAVDVSRNEIAEFLRSNEINFQNKPYYDYYYDYRNTGLNRGLFS